MSVGIVEVPRGNRILDHVRCQRHLHPGQVAQFRTASCPVWAVCLVPSKAIVTRKTPSVNCRCNYCWYNVILVLHLVVTCCDFFPSRALLRAELLSISHLIRFLCNPVVIGFTPNEGSSKPTFRSGFQAVVSLILVSYRFIWWHSDDSHVNMSTLDYYVILWNPMKSNVVIILYCILCMFFSATVLSDVDPWMVCRASRGGKWMQLLEHMLWISMKKSMNIYGCLAQVNRRVFAKEKAASPLFLCGLCADRDRHR